MARPMALVLAVALVTGCGTLDGAVRPEAAPVERVVMTHPGRRVEVTEAQFRQAMRWLAVEAVNNQLSVRPRARTGPRVVLASWDASQDRLGQQLAHEYSGWCQRVRHGPADCLSLGPGSFGFEEKRRLALSIAIGSFVAGAASELGEFLDPFRLEAMVVLSIATYGVLLVAPEPVTKFVAAVTTIGLYAYLGNELWDVKHAYEQMCDAADGATTFTEIAEAGDRFWRSVGAKATRILILMATAKLGSKPGEAIKRLPGFAQASGAVAFEPAALAGEEGALTLSGVLSGVNVAVLGKGRVTLVLGAVAMAAVGTPGELGRAKGTSKHHICTDKNDVSDATGGPWTPRFRRVFEQAGMTLDDPENLVEVEGHQGPHPEEYHKEVFRRVDRVTTRCGSVADCRVALTRELRKLAKEISTPGTELHRLVTSPGVR